MPQSINGHCMHAPTQPSVTTQEYNTRVNIPIIATHPKVSTSNPDQHSPSRHLVYANMVYSNSMPNKRLELQENLAVHTKMGDKRKLNQILREAGFLRCVKLDHISSLKIKVAERKAKEEGAIINGVRTVPGSNYYGTLRLLQDLSVQLCQMNDLPLNPKAVYESVICRTSRSVAAGDAYSKLKRIIKSSNLSLIRTDDAATRKIPCEIEMFESKGDLHATVSTTVSFGLVRNADLLYGKGDINQHGFLVNQRKGDPPEVWIKFDCIVTEKMNMSTGDYLRFANVIYQAYHQATP